MPVKLLPRSAVVSAVKRDVRSGLVADNAKLSAVEFVSKLLDRRWALRIPDAQIHQVMVAGSGRFKQQGGEVLDLQNNSGPSLGDSMTARNLRQSVFYVVRDDLLYPLVNGNKARKLDALLPLLEDHSVTDVVSILFLFQGMFSSALKISVSAPWLLLIFLDVFSPTFLDLSWSLV